VIRRLLVALTIVVGSTALFAGTSGATDFACVYNLRPLSLGLCASL
jgi:hypothetical protein